MSLSTKDAYAGFLQRDQLAVAAPMAGMSERNHDKRAEKPTEVSGAASPPIAAQIHAIRSLNRYQPLQSQERARSTSTVMADFDPLSPANLARASDPWYDNNLVKASITTTTATRSVDKDHGTHVLPATGDSTVALLDNPKDGEWGEFVTFTPHQDEKQGATTVSAQLAADTAPPPATKAIKRDGDHHARRSLASLPNKEQDSANHPNFSKAATPPPYPPYSRPPYLARNSMPSLPAQRSTRSFSDLLLERIASSFRGDQNGRSSSFADLFSLVPASSASSEAPPRSYDSYDVTFERGPIGLELETDWYGRQAVVKGFKEVNNGKDDGPAKLCGIIRVGDVLTAINGDSCLEMNFTETLARLRDVSHERHVLHFKSLEAAGDLSVYSNDLDIVHAKKLIHQHKEKFYQPPPRAKKKNMKETTANRETGQSQNQQAHQQQRDLIHGCVERLRGPTVTAFNFHRENTGEFLLACSCVSEATGVFLFHTLQDSHLREFKDLPQSEDSAVYLGQMTPNFIGTEFTLLDHQQKRRNELGFIEYTSNVLGRVPNFLKCVFPRPCKPSDGDEDDDEGDSESEDDGPDKDSDSETGNDGAVATDQTAQDTDRTDSRSQESQHPSRSHEASSIGTGMGDDSARFNTHNTMMDRNGNISERYKRLKQSRSLSIVERLRAFSLNDLDVSLELATAGITAVSENFESAWLDEDDHAGRSRVMRVKQARLTGIGRQPDASTPYGAVEPDDYQCDLIVFETKKPTWNETLGAWTLNFQGRVKMASKKNFMLVVEQGTSRWSTSSARTESTCGSARCPRRGSRSTTPRRCRPFWRSRSPPPASRTRSPSLKRKTGKTRTV